MLTTAWPRGARASGPSSLCRSAPLRLDLDGDEDARGAPDEGLVLPSRSVGRESRRALSREHDDRPAEAASGHAGAEDARLTASERDERVDLGEGDLVVVAQRGVRRI